MPPRASNTWTRERIVEGSTNGMSPGRTTIASAMTSSSPAWSDENIPRDGSGLTTTVTSRASVSVPVPGPTTSTRSSTPASRSEPRVRSMSGVPPTSARSFAPPKRSPEPAAGMTAATRIRACSQNVARSSLSQRCEHALGEDARGPLALGDRARGVVHRPRRLVDRVRGRGDRLIAERRPDERGGRALDEHRAGSHGGDRDPRVGDDAAVPAHRGRDPDDREVERTAVAQLHVRAAPARAVRDGDPCHDLVASDAEETDAVLPVEVGDREVTAAASALYPDGGAQREQCRDRIGA